VRPAATELSDSEAYDLSDAIARVVDARAPSLLALGPELALAATLGSLVLARVRFAGRKRGDGDVDTGATGGGEKSPAATPA
jgi:hypothetical protein